jgi:hypothetical protein
MDVDRRTFLEMSAISLLSIAPAVARSASTRDVPRAFDTAWEAAAGS